MSKDQWLEKRIAFIKGLKAPTDTQRMLLELADLDQPSKKDLRELDMLVRLEKINERAEEAKLAAFKIVQDRKDEARKARTRRLIELGGMVEMLDFPTDRGTLCGALMWALDQVKADSAVLHQLKTRGDEFIAQRETSKKTAAAHHEPGGADASAEGSPGLAPGGD